MINELASFPTRSDNVYFANNEQASIAVFTAVFCFTHAEHHLIKLKLYNNWSAQAVNSALCEIQRNQSNLLTFKNYPTINAESSCDRNNKSMYSCFYESKKFLSCLMHWEEKKTEDSENVFFKALAKNLLLTWKSCSWKTFYQTSIMKR